jgi:hypothetical protein
LLHRGVQPNVVPHIAGLTRRRCVKYALCSNTAAQWNHDAQQSTPLRLTHVVSHQQEITT